MQIGLANPTEEEICEQHSLVSVVYVLPEVGSEERCELLIAWCWKLSCKWMPSLLLRAVFDTMFDSKDINLESVVRSRVPSK